ncbi:MAG: hypothetical protein GXP45_04680 [bacterium]|nr:hypothetical protein [bacterium]
MTRIDQAIADKSFFRNKNLLNTISYCKKNNKTLHLMGLLQTQGVHASLDHILALLDACALQNFQNVFLHVFTDGRDAPVHEAKEHLLVLQDKLDELGFGTIVSLVGRYFAMDRDHRRERIQKAYDLIVSAQVEEGKSFDSALDAIVSAYEEGETDEFLQARKKKDYSGMQE